jgi:threonine synthase
VALPRAGRSRARRRLDRFAARRLDAAPGELAAARWAGLDQVAFKHEGLNPTGSFKDRGMTAAISRARREGVRIVACASTGNTAASLAAYAAAAELQCVVLAPEQGTALGKLSQALAHGARTLLVRGDFDAALRLVRAEARRGTLALLNSVNPLRVGGQQTIVSRSCRISPGIRRTGSRSPRATSATARPSARALRAARAAGLIDRAPRLLAVQAAGAAPFQAAYERGFDELVAVRAQTVASAIRIGDPASYARAVRAIRETNGAVVAVEDDALLEAKAVIDRAGIGCEPASAVSLAGVRALVQSGAIRRGERVVCVLTGHL